MTYQLSGRRWFDKKTQRMLKKRQQELAGLTLIALAAMAAAMLLSFSPDDPSWFSASDEPITNWMGPSGAVIAALAIALVGAGSWGFVLLPLAWGLRLVLHGQTAQLGWRIIFAPFALALAAIYAATLPLPPLAGYEFGLGGMFGTMVVNTIKSALALPYLPLEPYIDLAVVSYALGLLLVLMTWYVAGLTFADITLALRACLFAATLTYAGGAMLLRRGAYGVVWVVRHAPKPPVKATADKAQLAREQPAKAAPPKASPTKRQPLRALARIVQARLQKPPQSPAHPSLQRREPRVYRPENLEGAGAEASLPTPLVSAHAPSDLSAPTPEPPQAQAHNIVHPSPAGPSAEPQPPAPITSVPGSAEAPPPYRHPSLDLLSTPCAQSRHQPGDETLRTSAHKLGIVLSDYSVKGDIISIRPGPVVTMYELEPAPGLKASRVIGLADDIARSMSALSARVSTVPGRSVIGIELPNEQRETVLLREILATHTYRKGRYALPLALGKDIGGDTVIADLTRMPHLLIAGTTGSGKSVAVNTMILSLLYKLSPEECRVIMIDPKMLELSVYDDIPHLLSPVVTDPKKAIVALKWVVGEMEARYRKMSQLGVRNIDSYNARVEDALSKSETFTRRVQTGFDEQTGAPIFDIQHSTPERMPYIVVIVDEMADLMMVAGKEIEACIQRLAQMARASGIHLIMATQRPSVDVITGTIKANFPTRISFQVTSKVDSRTILGEMGAEQLLGMGDMLYMAGGGRIMRCHGPFVSDEEVEEVVRHLKSLGPPQYQSGVMAGSDEDTADEALGMPGSGGAGNLEDTLYDQAVAIVQKDRKCSTSYIQRKLSLGYNKAARLVERMEAEGVISAANHVGKREVLLPEAQ